jgi:uncharacterized protein YndB with AHSA1/START domain
VPTARRSRTISATTPELWELISDPHHLPRWWPRVTRVEDVEGQAFTEVLKTAKGRTVRADFELVESDQNAGVLRWAQQLEGTPFAGLLSSAHTAVRLESDGDATAVTIELIQSLNGFFSRFGSYMVKRAAGATLDEALDSLERIVG